MIEQLLTPIAQNMIPLIIGVMFVSLVYAGVTGMVVFFSIIELRYRSKIEVIDKQIELEKRELDSQGKEWR